MKKNIDYMQARDLLLGLVRPVETLALPLQDCVGAVLAQTLTAEENMPPFDRSAYDGHALRAADTANAARITRFLRGSLELSDGTVKLRLPPNQGNVVVSSIIGSNAIAVVPAGSGTLEAGTRLKGFMI